MPDLIVGDGSVVTITVPPPSAVTVGPPTTNPVVLVPVAGPPGRDGAAALPAVIDCGGPNNTLGA